MRAKRGVFVGVDWWIIGIYLFLVFFGWINIYAASFNEEASSIFAMDQAYGRQFYWIILSIITALCFLIIDAQFYKDFAYLIYGFCIFLLVAVLIFGTEIKGNKSWLILGPLSLQPAEFAKFGTALALSAYLADTTKKFAGFMRKAKAFVIILLPALLIILQPDTGSALVFTSFIFVLYREGLSGNILLMGFFAIVLFILALLLSETYMNLPFGLVLSGKFVLIASLAAIAFFTYQTLKRNKRYKWIILGGLLFCSTYIFSVDYVFDEVLSPHQQDRIHELLGIKSDIKGAGYNVHQSKIAIGSGGFSGKGFLQGTQTKFSFVPEQNTDFIFCTVGEEWGYIGSFVTVMAFLIFLFRIIQLSERQRSKFTRVFGYSIASVFFIHFAINIAMTIGLAPVIGIPLPFFSYGGSSVWAFTMLLFTLIKLDSERKYVLR